MFIRGATIIVLCACTMLALSSALPQHHQWHWSHPTHRGDSEAAAQQWPLNKPGPPGATLFDAQIQETGEQSCRTAIGRLSTNGETIQRSYHLCRQENPQVGLENEVACFYTTALCCLVPGLPQSVEEISVGSESVKVTYYSVGKGADLCYITDKNVTSCLPANCVPGCTGLVDRVCFNNTLTESEMSCANGTCQCKENFDPPDCCNCTQGYIETNGTCKKACPQFCKIRDPVEGCRECRRGYGPLPTCCNCTEFFYKTADETCEEPCLNNTDKCEDGVCSCKEGFGGPDCCQCRKNAVLSSCDDDGCDECKPGFATPDCCKCDVNFYEASDGTCKSPCLNNTVKCEDGVCTCKPDFGGRDCCQCRKNAILSTCDDDDCDECKPGFATPNCCKCDVNYYEASDGTCKSPCLNNTIDCTNGVCTCKAGFGGQDCCRCQDNVDSCTDTGCTCKAGFQGDDCCTPIPVVCTSVQDIYFVVDVTLSNFATPFCEEMYAVELISEAVDSQTGLDGTRIGAYIYPLTESTADTGIRYFKIGNDDCRETAQDFHTLMRAVSRGESNAIRPHVLGSATYPTPALKLLAKDINAEITSRNAPEDRKRVIVTLTDGGNDGNDAALQNAVNSLKTAGTQTTLIAAGIATATNNDNIDEFEAGVEMLAGGVKANTIISRDSGVELGRLLVDAMERNGVICKEDADEIRLRLPTGNAQSAYCECNLPGLKCMCPAGPQRAKCRAPPTDQCSSGTGVNLQSEDEEQNRLEEEIMAAVENVLVHEGIIEVDDY